MVIGSVDALLTVKTQKMIERKLSDKLQVHLSEKMSSTSKEMTDKANTIAYVVLEGARLVNKCDSSLVIDRSKVQRTRKRALLKPLEVMLWPFITRHTLNITILFFNLSPQPHIHINGDLN